MKNSRPFAALSYWHVFSGTFRIGYLVIPGRGHQSANRKSMHTDDANRDTTVSMDSGPGPSGRPGMTQQGGVYLFAAGAAAGLALLGVMTAVQAQSSGGQPDAKHGAVIVAQGTAAGAPPCAQCHAFNGVSDASGAFPRLAGQSAYYLAAQLRDFTSGMRASAIMSPIAKALSPDDIADVTTYFAGVNAPFLPLKAADPAVVKRGEELAKVGSAERRIQNCDNCHGPDGAGEPPAIPYLAGQYAHYIAFTLQMWRQGFRKNSPDGMGVIANKLDDQEIAAVAAYYQQIQSTLETVESQGKD
jgi:cytochrome c553